MRGILEGMGLTFSHLFRPKVTRLYPYEKPKLPARSRGLIQLIAEEGLHTEFNLKCEACLLCEKASFRVLRRAEDSDARPLAAYRSLGGYAALEKAIRQQTPEQVIQQVVDSRLRGLGGAGRLAGEKWRLVRKANDEQKYV